MHPDSTDPTPWVEFDALGNVTRRMGCTGGLKSRFHELVAEADGSWWILCDDTRVMDLSAVGGHPAAHVIGTVVQHVDDGGRALFQWSPFDHFAITDLDSASRMGAVVNWTHGNALTFDSDGRSAGFIPKSERNHQDRSGHRGGAMAARWPRQSVRIAGTPTPFVGQHGLRVRGPGDRVARQPGRARRFQGGAIRGRRGNRLTAQLSATYSPRRRSTPILGVSTQSLPGGRILVAYGNGNRVQEYDAHRGGGLGNVR